MNSARANAAPRRAKPGLFPQHAEHGDADAARGGGGGGEGELGDLGEGADDGDLVAAVALGAPHAVAPDLQRERVLVDHVEAELAEKGVFVGEGEEPADAQAAGLVDAP